MTCAVTYADLAAWKAAGKDAASTEGIDPMVVVAGGNWKSSQDLHFDVEPAAAQFGVSALAGAGNDIDNEARPNPATSQIEKGADEFYMNTSVNDWALY